MTKKERRVVMMELRERLASEARLLRNLLPSIRHLEERARVEEIIGALEKATSQVFRYFTPLPAGSIILPKK